MLDKTMRIKLLPAPLIISDFVRNEPNCNYELYLLELINKSSYFSKKYPEGFERPASESNGECDAINENYEIDFKLLAAKTALMAQSILSRQVSKIAEGTTAFGVSKVQNGKVDSTYIYTAFRGLSFEELVKIRNTTTKSSGVKNDICTVLEMLEKKKNLMLFFPYEFSFDTLHNFEEAINSISQGLKNDFQEAFKYREIKASGYDTFLICIYDNKFIIFKIENQSLYLCETVTMTEITAFMELKNSYTDLV